MAAAYSYANFSSVASWDPASICAQAVANADNIDAEAAYLIEDNGEFVALLKGSEITLADYNGMTIRKANERGGFGEAVTITATPAPEVQEGQVFVFTDPHVVTKAVAKAVAEAEGKDFSSDNKMPEYSQEIFDIMIGKIKAAMPEMVLVPGDLTYNGEKSGHEYVSAKLNELTDLGIKVYVIPGNHDIDNSNAFGGTTVTKDEFISMYGAQGYNDAVMQSDNASYMVYPNDDLAIIGINTSLPSYNSNGGFSYDLLTWVENAAAKAKLSGRQVIAMTHHQLMEHFDNQLKASTTSVCNINLHESDAANYPSVEEVRERLLAAGINTVFTGHYHIQSVSQVVNDTYGTLTDISTGALSGYPMAYRTATIEKARITTASANITDNLSEITNAEVLSTGTTRLNNRATEMATVMLGTGAASLPSNMLGSAVCALAAGNEQDASNKSTELNNALTAISLAQALIGAEKAALGTAVVNSIWNNTINGTFVDDYACNKAYPNLNLTFNDGTEYTCTQAPGTFNVTYRRSFKDGIYQPLFVPFSFPMSALNPSAENDNYLVAEFTAEPVEFDEENERLLIKLTSQANTANIAANTPYIIKRAGDGQMAAYIQNAQFQPAVSADEAVLDLPMDVKIYGTYQPKSGLKSMWAVALKDNMLKPAASDAVTLKPQRWFMTLPVTSAKPSIMFVIDDQPTGITTPMAPAAMRNAKYSIGGMQLQNASPAQGIIITDGDKYSTK